MRADDTFEELIDDAVRTPFQGWDFSYLKGRITESALPWDYATRARERMRVAQSMLDMGTGGGEFLSSLAPLPPSTSATEGYAPNVILARQRLEPLGVKVFDMTGDQENRQLPFPAEHFDLVINRHEAYVGKEVWRILRPRGCFLTQQCGGRDPLSVVEYLKGAVQPTDWTVATASKELDEAGFRIADQRESYAEYCFLDIGAVVYYLRAIPWLVEDFSVDTYRDRLFAMHTHIQKQGGLRVQEHRFLIEAVKLRC